MGSILSEYNSIHDSLLQAISSVLPTLADELEAEVNRQAEKNVYSYGATPQAMNTRRWTIADGDNFEREYGEDYVSITNVAEMQGTDYGIQEVDFVEQGLQNYNQPYPREFMNKGLEEYTKSGKADKAVAESLERYGLTAEITVYGE